MSNKINLKSIYNNLDEIKNMYIEHCKAVVNKFYDESESKEYSDIFYDIDDYLMKDDKCIKNEESAKLICIVFIDEMLKLYKEMLKNESKITYQIVAYFILIDICESILEEKD